MGVFKFSLMIREKFPSTRRDNHRDKIADMEDNSNRTITTRDDISLFVYVVIGRQGILDTDVNGQS
jgi:hypothetical protein